MLQLIHFFSAENIKANYWSNHCSSENRLIFALQCIGSFYFLWSSKISLEDYIHSQLRLKKDEITQFKEQKFFRINKYKALASELGETEAVSWITEFFSTDLTSDSKREELRNDDFVLDVLDNLVCFEQTFESAMDILAALSDFDYDFDESSQCYIQYRVNLNFSPLLGGISYQQRLRYLENRLFLLANDVEEFRSLSLIRAMYHSLKFMVLKGSDAEFGSAICEDKDICWEIPTNDASTMAYCLNLADLIIQAARRAANYELGDEAKRIIAKFIEDNMANAFASHKILYKFLISVPIPVDIDDYANHDWCDSLYIESFYCLNKIKDRALDQLDSHMLFARSRLENLIICIAVNKIIQLSNMGLLNTKPQEHYNWFLSILDLENEEVKGIIYLYNFCNGANMWESDCLKMSKGSSLATFVEEQIDNRINYMIGCSIRIQNQIIETGQFTSPPIFIDTHPQNDEEDNILRLTF
ncbi:MAG: hypothetical protein H0U70_11790 [Tatlockia sp.]|nr:hypothetical protein [Tatlockia sp.]